VRGEVPTLSPEDVDETGGFLADVIEANRYVETGQKTGNVVLTVSHDRTT
jgi:hypothetical protein